MPPAPSDHSLQIPWKEKQRHPEWMNILSMGSSNSSLLPLGCPKPTSGQRPHLHSHLVFNSPSSQHRTWQRQEGAVPKEDLSAERGCCYFCQGTNRWKAFLVSAKWGQLESMANRWKFESAACGSWGEPVPSRLCSQPWSQCFPLRFIQQWQGSSFSRTKAWKDSKLVLSYLL